MLKIDRSDWSKSFSLDAVGNAGDLVCEERKTSRKYEVIIILLVIPITVHCKKR